MPPASSGGCREEPGQPWGYRESTEGCGGKTVPVHQETRSDQKANCFTSDNKPAPGWGRSGFNRLTTPTNTKRAPDKKQTQQAEQQSAGMLCPLQKQPQHAASWGGSQAAALLELHEVRVCFPPAAACLQPSKSSAAHHTAVVTHLFSPTLLFLGEGDNKSAHRLPHYKETDHAGRRRRQGKLSNPCWQPAGLQFQIQKAHTSLAAS